MKCPKCGYDQPHGGGESCLRCGVVFSKYARRRSEDASPPAPSSEVVSGADEPVTRVFDQIFLHVNPEINIFNFGGRVLLYAALVVFGAVCILSPMSYDNTPMRLLHLVNLPFHEAGHIIFGFFGRFIAVLGGSLMQLLIPLVCIGAFLFQTRDTFGASVGVWWLGESLMDLAPYINDARALRMILLGGVTGRDVADYHDWEYLLRHTGLLRYDHLIAYTAYGTGVLLMVISFAWGGYLLTRQYRNLHW